ncbi:MAG: glycogen/starch/alpha-glucan phosphorylase, partial [Gallicola sp.]|nr:glycogen/starch/alpha-glucan phosphorylase [Gallicola sp.]
YKRQLLNALQILDLYFRMKRNPDIEYTPKTFIFGAKAAPGYFRAKAIIKFINEVARLINEDPEVNSRLQVVFVENYNVSYGEKLFPAADVSEQISTAGKEASGTGNMKFMMNGAVTIGTLDGANVEIFREAGLENNYLFGAKTEELAEIFDSYNPVEYYMKDPDIKKAVDFLMDEKLDDDGTYMLLEIYKSLIDPHPGHKADRYFVLKDFESYKKAQQQIGKDYTDRRGWARKCLINIANCGKFSSDRTIRDYAEGIWKI